ncbi:hypothetical protein X777_11560 [Ooceraea biroi]|uniref:Uncharacterized protein n=1 Tax=Ooceraea biroi TaxID=2015173 RepID=A0A026W227_OOCBI|nr:hypothetical protein X777_11560 [Ooceraea biroi]
MAHQGVGYQNGIKLSIRKAAIKSDKAMRRQTAGGTKGRTFTRIQILEKYLNERTNLIKTFQ